MRMGGVLLTRVAAVTLTLLWLAAAVIALYTSSRAGDDGLSIQASSFAPRPIGPLDAPVLIAGVAPDGPAARAGITRGSLLHAVDGVPVGDTAALRHLIYTRRAGDTTTLRVASPDSTSPRDVVVPLVSRLSRPGSASFVFTYLASGLLALAVVVPLALARPHEPVTRLLLLAGGSGAIWQALDAIYGGLRERWLPLGWDSVDQLSYLIAIVNTFALLHLFLVFPSRLSLPLPPRLTAALTSTHATLLLYAVPLAVVLVLFTLHYSPVTLIWGTIALVLVAALAVLLYGYVRPVSPLARAQLRWIGTAVLIIAILFVAGPMVEVSTGGRLFFVRWVTAISSFALLYLAIALAVLRYRLFDVHIVLRATLVYPLLALLLPSAYLTLSWLVAFAAGLALGSTAAGDELAGHTSTHVVLGLFIAASFTPLRARLLRLVDLLLYRERRALDRFYDETTTALARARPIDEVETLLTRGAVQQLDLDGAWLIRPPAVPASAETGAGKLHGGMVLEEWVRRTRTEHSLGGLARIVSATTPPHSNDATPSPLIAATLLFRLRRVSGPHLLTHYAFFRAPVPVLHTNAPGSDDLAAWYDAGARLLVPLRVQDELVGLWVLGQRRSLELPDRADLAAIERIANRAAVLLDYARLHESHLTTQLAAQRQTLDAERVRALEQLNRTVLQERATLAALMESMRDGLIVAGGAGGGDDAATIRYCSSRAATLLGIDVRHALGQSPDVLLGAALRDAIQHPSSSTYVTAPTGYTAPASRPLDGAIDEVTLPGPPRRDLRLEWFPVSDGQTQLGYGLLVRDVTEERTLERAKDEFTSMLSHELRSPIGIIKGFAATLLHAEGVDGGATGDSGGSIAALTDDERRESLRFVELASDQLLDLVNNLLDLSRISAGRFAVDPRPTPLGALVETTARQLEAARSTHRILVDVPATLPSALIDPARITQVLRNLLDNAMKDAPSGSTIRVEATLQGEELAVSVTDEGGGIPPDELPHLFERYHRGRDARTRNVAGAGLGLAISRHLVEAHGGLIRAQSPVPGQTGGARLTFTFPVARGPGGDLPQRTGPGEQPSTREAGAQGVSGSAGQGKVPGRRRPSTSSLSHAN